MRKFKSMRAAREAYAKIQRTCGIPFEQWMFEEVIDRTEKINDAASAASFIRHYVHVSSTRESFWVLLLDAAHHPLCMPVCVSNGMLNGTPAGPREVFAEAVWWQAAAIVVAHNHPSGDPTPSNKDMILTKELMAASRIMRIILLDHVIITDDLFISLREGGYYKFNYNTKGKRK